MFTLLWNLNELLELAASFSGSVTRWMPASVLSKVQFECRNFSRRALFTCFIAHHSSSHEEIPLNPDWLISALYVFVKLNMRLVERLEYYHTVRVSQTLLFTLYTEHTLVVGRKWGFWTWGWCINQIYCNHVIIMENLRKL